VFGALIGQALSHRYGRNLISIISDAIICVGFIIILLWCEIGSEMLGRFIQGFGTGIQMFSITMYLREVGLPQH